MGDFIQSTRVNFSSQPKKQNCETYARGWLFKSKPLCNVLIFLVILFNLLFLGCSNSIPNVVKTECTVVFNYEDQSSQPAAWLSVFLQSTSDVRRCERIKVHSIDAKYLWESNNVRKIGMGNFQWAGNFNFIVPNGEKIPDGKYEITYINADEESQVSYTDLKYDKELYNLKAGDIRSHIGDSGILNLAIFDSNDVLLFFGETTEDFSTTGDMLEKYNNASYYKEVVTTFDGSVICILPKTQL